MKNIIITLIIMLSVSINLFSQQIIVQKDLLNKFINTVQYIQLQKNLQTDVINKQNKQIELLQINQQLLIKQIEQDSLYIVKLNKQLTIANQKKWYQNKTFIFGIGYLLGIITSYSIYSTTK